MQKHFEALELFSPALGDIIMTDVDVEYNDLRGTAIGHIKPFSVEYVSYGTLSFNKSIKRMVRSDLSSSQVVDLALETSLELHLDSIKEELKAAS